VAIGDERVLVDPPDARGVRAELRLDAGRQAVPDRRQVFENTAARPVDVRAVLEQHVAERQLEHRHATHVRGPGHGQQRTGQRVGDLIVDDLRVLARILGDDDDLHVGQVGGQRFQRPRGNRLARQRGQFEIQHLALFGLRLALAELGNCPQRRGAAHARHRHARRDHRAFGRAQLFDHTVAPGAHRELAGSLAQARRIDAEAAQALAGGVDQLGSIQGLQQPPLVRSLCDRRAVDRRDWLAAAYRRARGAHVQRSHITLDAGLLGDQFAPVPSQPERHARGLFQRLWAHLDEADAEALLQTRGHMHAGRGAGRGVGAHQLHAADRAIAGSVLTHLGVHRAGPDFGRRLGLREFAARVAGMRIGRRHCGVARQPPAACKGAGDQQRVKDAVMIHRGHSGSREYRSTSASRASPSRRSASRWWT
jgi:hypothetical protein